jgi:hypothetical protein
LSSRSDQNTDSVYSNDSAFLDGEIPGLDA